MENGKAEAERHDEEEVQRPYDPKKDCDVILNRIAVAMARREALVESWMSKSAIADQPRKTDEELDAEDALLFQPQPPYLGVGASIPAEYLVGDEERNKKALRAKFFPTKGLKASKARDADEKAASAKRALNHDSSDEEQGRSGLGRAKKLKIAKKGELVRRAKDHASSEVNIEGSISSALEYNQSIKSKATGPEKKAEHPEKNHSTHAVGYLSTPKINVATNGRFSDEEMDDAPGDESMTNGTSVAEPSMDAKERKKIKKREKRKRKKLRDAEMASKTA